LFAHAFVFLSFTLTASPPPPSTTLFPYTTLFRSWIEWNKVYESNREVIPSVVREIIGSGDFIAGLTDEMAISLLADQIGGDESADRKSTRLNSSHVSISYAVFCLKTKMIQDDVD